MRPGELSCAHRGVLFLDELGEFPSDVLDTLRQPLEEGQVLVCRARASVVFPARVLLVAAMNPCPCGGEGGPGSCRCRDTARTRYTARVSGPLLDRFDLRVVVDRPEVSDLLPSSPPITVSESTATVAARVQAARARASVRGVGCNAAIPGPRLDQVAPLDKPASKLPGGAPAPRSTIGPRPAPGSPGGPHHRRFAEQGWQRQIRGRVRRTGPAIRRLHPSRGGAVTAPSPSEMATGPGRAGGVSGRTDGVVSGRAGGVSGRADGVSGRADGVGSGWWRLGSGGWRLGSGGCRFGSD